MAVLQCTETVFVFDDSGIPRELVEGDVFDDKDPAVKKYPQFFQPVEVNAVRATDRAIEQATAAPGETRAVKRAPKATKSAK